MSNEQMRLERLRSLDLLDTVQEPEFDDVVKIASAICGTQIALISLIDETRQWFKACVGLGLRQTARDVAFCDHTIRSREPMIIPDARMDARFQNNPFVTGLPGIRFYAGVPLWTKDGFCIGSLCVIDVIPRDLSVRELEGLMALARQLMRQIETRSALADMAIDRVQLKQAQQQLQDFTKRLPIGVYNVDKDRRCCFVNDAWVRIAGVTREEATGYGHLKSAVEEDRLELFQRAQEAWAKQATFEFSGRVRRPDGEIRYVDLYSEPDLSGGRIGCIIDVTDRVTRIHELEKELLRLRPSVLKKAE